MSARAGVDKAELERAYQWCAGIVRGHYENFPVASFLLPAPMRPAIAAIYAFARRADDFADEPGPSDAERIRLLDDWRQRLHAPVSSPRPHDPDDLIFIALDDAIRRHSLPLALFDDLLSAFRQDVSTRRYATWDDVLDYCRRSANPVGRLVLRVAGRDTPALDAQSDAICTALQLTNFWQDFGVDWRRGRLYLPVTERDRAGASEHDLEEARWTPAWRQAMGAAVVRTRDLFARGRPLCAAVPGRLGWELRFTWLGGSRVLDKVESSGDLLNHRARLHATDVPLLLARAAAWR